jgi:SAM-dependent methyltransferase
MTGVCALVLGWSAMRNGTESSASTDPDPKAMVREGYDRISRAYRGDSVGRDRSYFRWLDRLIPLLQAGDPVLDLGCGCGIPTSEVLAASFRVTGVDFSETQIDRAQSLVPRATFLRADMTAIDFPAGSFAAIVAFYSVIHVPLAEQRPLFGRLFDWLRAGGYLLVTVGHTAWTGTEDDWHGAPMYWSHADEGTYLVWLQEIGFAVRWREFVPEGDGGHVLLLAQRPEG